MSPTFTFGILTCLLVAAAFWRLTASQRHAFACAAAMLVLFVGCDSKQATQINLNSQLKVGSAFPDISGTDIDGESISISEFKGKVVLLDFFGDW
ncbi:peroxiredoxin family protein [Mariniblastus fucicola]|uniref:Thiol-disulfide oxidoreductase ResA n=1 Tax=Mariniblastus fucicola TaxID=980251 RepID=A0A5B9PLJ7_9BACT|nr:hypothetical protein [Mariniblastus fucicola]QEG23213.1 Thiol-disulfide oxidoreductase ResA [Mariniblastus fucicola]